MLSAHALHAFAQRHGITIAKIICTTPYSIPEPTSPNVDLITLFAEIQNLQLMVPKEIAVNLVTVSTAQHTEKEHLDLALEPLGRQVAERHRHLLKEAHEIYHGNTPDLLDSEIEICANSDDAVELFLKYPKNWIPVYDIE